MADVYLVRHGPTHAKSMVGWSDLPADLSDTRLITRVAEALPKDASVISSDLTRARDTADAVAGAQPRLPHDPDLREIHFGDWELKTWAEIDAETPDLSRAFWESPGDVRPPGGESWNEVSTRVTRAIDRALAQTSGALIVVAHFGAILTQIQRAERLTADEAFAHRIEPLSLTHLSLTPGTDGGQTHLINHIP